MVDFTVLNVPYPFLANVPILYFLKTPENLWFLGVSKGVLNIDLK